MSNSSDTTNVAYLPSKNDDEKLAIKSIACRDSWTVWEFSFLLIGRLPPGFGYDPGAVITQMAETYARQVKRVIAKDRDYYILAGKTSENTIQECNGDYHYAEFPYEAFESYAKAHNVKRFAFILKEREISIDALVEKSLSEEPIYPWGSYSTRRVRALADGIHNWWSTFDPNDISTAPKSSEVSQWFQEKYAFSKKEADVLTAIIRADGLPKNFKR